MPPPANWIVDDGRRTARDAAMQAAARAAAQAWSSDSWSGSEGSRVDDLRWLGVSTAGVLYLLQGPQVPAGGPGEINVTGPFPASGDELNQRAQKTRIANALLDTFNVMGAGVGAWEELRDALLTGKAKSLTFRNAGATREAAALPQAAVLVIACTAWVAGVAAVAYFASNVVDRELARLQETRRMLERHSQVLEQLAQHAAEETKAGTPLPVSPLRQQLVDALLDAQKAAAAKVEKPGVGPDIELPSFSEIIWPLAIVAGAVLLLK